jgi:hypothetical protein
LRQSSSSSFPSENQSTDRQSFLITENSEHSDELSDDQSVDQSVKQPDEPSVEPTVEPSDEPLDESSVELPVGSSDEPLVESPDGPSVEPSDEPSVEPSDGLSVEQSFKSSTPSSSSAHSPASLTAVNQPRGQSFKPLRRSAPLTLVSQSMERLMGQLMRRSMDQSISGIHVRCGIGWIRGSLLNETGQWLLNNRANHLFKVVSVSDQKVLSTWGNLTE